MTHEHKRASVVTVPRYRVARYFTESRRGDLRSRPRQNGIPVPAIFVIFISGWSGAWRLASGNRLITSNGWLWLIEIQRKSVLKNRLPIGWTNAAVRCYIEKHFDRIGPAATSRLIKFPFITPVNETAPSFPSLLFILSAGSPPHPLLTRPPGPDIPISG